MTQRSKDPQFETAASDREGKPVLPLPKEAFQLSPMSTDLQHLQMVKATNEV